MEGTVAAAEDGVPAKGHKVSEPGARPEPPADCGRCPRLVAYRHENRRRFPDFFNGAVPSFGDEDARLLIVGLAPGLKGANRTGRPFTGDAAGSVLYPALLALGLACGHYDENGHDDLRLTGVMITNALRCVPPANKPTAAEIRRCNPYLRARIASLSRLGVILALGRIAHDAVLRALGVRLAAHPFAHGTTHVLGRYRLVDSYHCSRYNMNTGRLSEEAFRAVLARARALAFPANGG